MYIGSSPNFGALDSQTITSANGSTATFTLNQYVPDSDSIIVTVGNVVQEPTEAYTASGNSITFTENVPNGDTIVIRYLGRSVDVYTGYKRVQRFKYVATNGQQTFSGADANSRTLEYTAQDIDVFYNGVRLDESEFTATNGSSVILGTGATTNAELVILAYKVVQLADVVPASSGGTFTGNVVFSGNATVNGNLTASGTTTLVDTTNTVIKDNLLGLNHGATSNSNDAGIIVERGSTGNDALLIWDESEDKWALGTTTSNASSTGNLNMTTGTLVANLEGTIQTASQTNITAVGTLTGLSTSGNISLADNGEVRVGTGNDLVIKHDGSNSFINDTGTGDLRITGSQVRILSDAINLSNSANNEDMVTASADGAVKLSFDGTTQLATQTNGINLHNTTVSGNPANAKFIIDSSSQYDGIALGSGASSAVIGRHSNGAGMHFTANSAPANMGGGNKVGFQFSSGSSGGGGPTDLVTIQTDGKVGVNTTSPAGHSSPNGARLCVHTSSGASMIQINATGANQSSGLEFTDDSATGQLHYHHGSNTMVFTVNATQHFSIGSDGTLLATDTSIGSISDERLKTNIKDYTYDLEVFKKFKPKTFDWKNPKEHGDKSNVRGFIAQDILDVDNVLVGQTDIEPQTAIQNLDAKTDLIPKDNDGKRFSYTSKLNGNDAMYISVIQQLITRIEALEKA